MWLKELSLSVGSPLKRLPINLERSLCLTLWAFGPPPPHPALIKKGFLSGKGTSTHSKTLEIVCEIATSRLARLSSCIVGVSLLTDEETRGRQNGYRQTHVHRHTNTLRLK